MYVSVLCLCVCVCFVCVCVCVCMCVCVCVCVCCVCVCVCDTSAEVACRVEKKRFEVKTVYIPMELRPTFLLKDLSWDRCYVRDPV